MEYRPDPSHREFGYWSCKQETKERYWGQQFGQMERGTSRPTAQDNLTRQSGPTSKVVLSIPVGPNHLVHWSIPLDVPIEISRILGWIESAPCLS